MVTICQRSGGESDASVREGAPPSSSRDPLPAGSPCQNLSEVTTNKTFDPRNQPAYPIAEAARYLRVPTATLRTWALGGESASPLFALGGKRPPTLSFWNLVEAHVIRALRANHGVSLGAVRRAKDFAETKLGIERLFLSKALSATAGKVFLQEYGKLIDLSASGQIALREVFESHLQRIEWDKSFPFRFYPFVTLTGAPSRSVVIDARLSFGRPILSEGGISTAAVAGRLDAGESEEDIAHDYNLSLDLVRQAALYERAA